MTNEIKNQGGRPPKDDQDSVINKPVRALLSNRIIQVLVKEQKELGLEPKRPGPTGTPTISSDMVRLALYHYLNSKGYMEDPSVLDDDTWNSLYEKELI